MDRRGFLAGAAALLVALRAAEAQPTAKIYRIGLLIPAPAPVPGVMPPIIVPAFLAGMRERGWLENQGFVLEPRYAEGRVERLPELAGELVRLKVDVIVAMGTPAAMAAKLATTTIPVVFGLVGDPVGSGVVTNLARPGGNVTGMSVYLPEVFGKALEILKEALPRAELVVMTRDPDNRAQNLADANADPLPKPAVSNFIESMSVTFPTTKLRSRWPLHNGPMPCSSALNFPCPSRWPTLAWAIVCPS